MEFPVRTLNILASGFNSKSMKPYDYYFSKLKARFSRNVIFIIVMTEMFENYLIDLL